MVDVVSPRTMPSESEVHVARSFLTKILRSSMRRNRFRGKDEAVSRPHSWHSSKLTEEDSEPARSEANPAPVWQPKHEARSKETFPQADQGPLHQDGSPPSSVNNMERVERPAHPFPPGRLSPPKYGSAEPLGGARRDSPFSCFSSGSSPPIHDSSSAGQRGTSTESIFFKGFQGDGAQPGDRHRPLRSAGWDGSRGEEQPACRVSFAGRPSGGPVWQAPEKQASQSPPPPAPPLRSDSFAVTKVFPYSDGPSGAPKSGRSLEKLSDSSQRRPSKLFSLSSSDVRQSHYALPPAHQRQHSDESPFYLQARAAPPTRIQSVGSYYRSLQDLPANAFSRRQGRHSAAATNHSQESGGVSRYYGPVAKQTAELKARQGCSSSPWMNSSDSLLPASLKTKGKFSAPPTTYGEKKEHSSGLTHEFSPRDTDDPLKRGEVPSSDPKRLIQSSNHKVASSQHQDPWLPQEDQRISSVKTPLLHSLTQESWSLTAAAPASVTAQDAGSGKVNRRSDRYATTLRKEIQQKRAQLQKSRSAATLTCEPDDEEPEEWRSMEPSASSGVSSYKDHLKEAQARVLQATSFQRRDLEPLGAEVLKVSNGRFRGRKRFHPAKRTHSFSEPDKMDKVGVEGDPQMGEDERKVFQAKPAFARPALKSTHTDHNQTTQMQEKARPSNDDIHLSPGRTPGSLEQQRLGTFAEYQATWNKQKKTAEAKTPGKFHSAENILDPGAEETPVCVHERSRSSPSADFYAQKIPSGWRDPEDQQSTSTSREKLESRQSVPAVSRNPGPDHRTKADTASASQTAPTPGPRCISPSCLLLPPVPHLGPETTSSSQEFPTGSQSDPAALQTLPRSGSDFHADAQPSPSAPAPARSPHQHAAAGPDTEGAEEESERPPSLSPPSPSPPAAALPLPGPDPVRSPSPQFTPARLTDKPPAVQDESQLRWDKESKFAAAMEAKSPVRKVPVRIIRSENGSEREGGAYLTPTSDTCSPVGLQSHAPLSETVENSSASPFSTFTRQSTSDPEQPSSQECRSTGPVEEDAKREELARDIMGKDKSLADILDQSGRKTTMDLMEGLFPPEEKILEGAQQRRRASAGSRLPTSAPRSLDRREEDELSSSAVASLVPSSSYYNTSAPKAELLIKMKDMQEQLEEQDSEDELDIDLASKKQELILSLARKLEVLREARQSLQEDVEDNEALGREVEATVQRLCQPNQLDKFRMFVGDLDKVVSLLLSLSGRLARVENALNSLEDEAPPEEKRTLTEKHKLLMRQHEDAKELKENLDRRERLVTGVMEAHLDAASLDDYRHFVKMKSALIIEQRKLEDKIKLGEEQLKCLLESLPLEQRPPF
ncbi:protein Shroom2 isoform X2 [Oryzias melastigma]|uniref:Shroom family member 2 n=1 Tax=Oryzias melastigma TaxID=30732 RepID=A0A3B3CGX2_ORYME|nr:protein Shroom2 isoform X2 [Oryzias melastigma]